MNYRMIFSTLGLLLLVDRMTKYFVVSGWSWQSSWVRIERFDNFGLVFSFPTSRFTASVLMIVALIIVAIWFGRALRHHAPQTFSLGLIFVGALSNVYDRLTYGAVVDLFFFGRWFPIFNLADVAIAIGAVGWIRLLTKRSKVS